MALTKGGGVPNAGTPDAGYPAPTPHAAVAAHQVYEAPTDGEDYVYGLNETGSAGSAVDGMMQPDNAGFTPGDQLLSKMGSEVFGGATEDSPNSPMQQVNDMDAAQGSVKAYDAMAGLSNPQNVSGMATGFDQGSSPAGPAVEADMGTPREDGIQFGSPGTYGFDNP